MGGGLDKIFYYTKSALGKAFLVGIAADLLLDDAVWKIGQTFCVSGCIYGVAFAIWFFWPRKEHHKDVDFFVPALFGIVGAVLFGFASFGAFSSKFARATIPPIYSAWKSTK